MGCAHSRAWGVYSRREKRLRLDIDSAALILRFFLGELRVRFFSLPCTCNSVFFLLAIRLRRVGVHLTSASFYDAVDRLINVSVCRTR